jgi:molybdopterin-guanine dinucleotide biosynthesis protein A
LTQEDPPFTGPAQATAAGVAALGLMEESSGVVLLLACDIPAADAALTAALEWLLASDLLQGDSPRWDGVVCTDTSGHEQWLLGCYRASALARVCAQLGSDQRSMRALLGDLRLARLTIDESTAADIDTWEAAEQLGYTVSPPYLDKSQLETATAKLN